MGGRAVEADEALPMASQSEMYVCEIVRRYLSGELKLYQFEDLLAGLLWEADANADEGLAGLLGEIHIALAEVSSGEISVSEMQQELVNAIRPFVCAQCRPPQFARPTLYIPNTWMQTDSANHLVQVSARGL